MKTSKKALVIATGSIGMRHLRNMQTLGVEAIAVVEPDDERRQAACSETGVEGFATLEEGLNWKPDIAVVASPNSLHVEHAQAAAECGCDLFIEKPLSHTRDGLEELAETIERKKLVSIVGCNMRFHPGPAKVKEIIDSGVVGKVLFQQVYTGSYLPGWRPWQDYTKSYSANASMGGGVILDCIHEIDLTRWYAGPVKDVFSLAGHISSLKIDTEDYAVLICKHAGGVVSEVHLDYVQRTYERGCRIVGENGSIFWDFRRKEVQVYTAGNESWKTYPEPENWDVNGMYIEEMRHFLACVETRTPTVLPVSDAIHVMDFAFAAKRSAQSHRFEEAE